jgi:striatin 1/3/4
MRFLQTEWHRHERERNAWEIERLEMKSRIAALEGQARRADATQKALNKYVTMLQKKLKDQQAAQLEPYSGGKTVGMEVEKPAAKLDRVALIQEKLRCEWKTPSCTSDYYLTRLITLLQQIRLLTLVLWERRLCRPMTSPTGTT